MTRTWKTWAGLAGLGLTLWMAAGGAQAQNTSPEPGYAELFYTDNNLAAGNDFTAGTSTTYLTSFGRGIGYSGGNFDGLFTLSPDASTAQTLFQPFIFRGSSSVATSDFIQIGIHSYSESEQNQNTQTVYASIFLYKSQGTGKVPLGDAVVTNIPIVLNSKQPTAGFGGDDYLYYSDPVALPDMLCPGKQYVIAFAPATSAGTNSPANFALINTIAFSRSNVPSADRSFFGTIFETIDNSATTPPSGSTVFTEAGPLAFRLYASVLTPVPSLSSLSPSSTYTGSGDTTLTLNGSGFVSGATISFGGQTLATTFVSSTKLTAVVPSSLLTTTTKTSVTITNPRACTSGSQSFTVKAPLSGLSLSASSITGGGSVTGTVTLASAAPSGGEGVSLSSSNTAAATVPSSVTVASGQTTATFTVQTKTVDPTTTVTISAAAKVTKTATLTVKAATGTVGVQSLSVSPTSVKGGAATSTGTVTLSSAAPSGGVAVTLKSSDTSAATATSTLNIAAGATSAKFKITTYAVSSTRTVTLTASANGTSKTATLTVTGGSGVVGIQSLSLSPTSVKGGSSSTGTITLTGPAPASGVSVTQKSSDTSVATLAGTLNIASGATSAKFKITTKTVTSTKSVTITSSANSTSKTATLSVTK